MQGAEVYTNLRFELWGGGPKSPATLRALEDVDFLVPIRQIIGLSRQWPGV